jgi:hypothetical protein
MLPFKRVLTSLEPLKRLFILGKFVRTIFKFNSFNSVVTHPLRAKVESSGTFKLENEEKAKRGFVAFT